MRPRRPPAALALALVSLAALAARADGPDPCAGRGTVLLVLAKDHRLHLCEKGRSAASYKVALGSGGVGKQKRGDEKTPLGTYALGAPRASKKFGTFIPLGYPTREQRARGFTGGDVGVHGPARTTWWLGRMNTWIDWTQGCVAVATDRDMAEVARFVRRNKVARAVLE